MPSAPARSAPTRLLTTDATVLRSPLLLVNLKQYPAALGAGAEQIGALLGACGRAAGVEVALAPATTDLRHLATTLSLPVLAQHVDPRAAGACTGYTVPEAILSAGARGSLVNHSEHPMPHSQVAVAVDRLRVLGLTAIVCARDVQDAARLARFQPPYIAVEPPELIGGRRSVATARPRVISDSVEAIHRVAPRTRVLCGAGVNDRDDVAKALELGTDGVLVASAVATSATPRAAIEELLAGF